MLYDTCNAAMNMTKNVVTDDGMSENDVSIGNIFGLLAPILVVIVMCIILVLSFYKFHKRLHNKKEHHIDYIRANLPLKRPRISPPNMTTFNAFDWKSLNAGYLYEGVPHEDYVDCDTQTVKIEGSNNRTVDFTITEKLDLKCSKVKKSLGTRCKSGDKFDRYQFELVPTICQPESDYLPGDEIFY